MISHSYPKPIFSEEFEVDAIVDFCGEAVSLIPSSCVPEPVGQIYFIIEIILQIDTIVPLALKQKYTLARSL